MVLALALQGLAQAAGLVQHAGCFVASTHCTILQLDINLVTQRAVAELHPVRLTPALRAVRSVFNDEKKLSIAALSQTLPERLIEQTTP